MSSDLRPLASITALLLLSGVCPASDDPPVRAITGKGLPGLAHLNKVMRQVLREKEVSGGSLAIAKDGRLVFARGFGLADVEDRVPVRPKTLFNIASCTKAITGMAILKLVDEGKLRLDTPFLEVVKDINPSRSAEIDRAVFRITVRQLLHHSGGFARDMPQVNSRDLRDHIRKGIQKPLEFPPGTRSHYSNFGFQVLKLVVADVSGETYEGHVQKHLLKPAGIHDMGLDSAGGYVTGEAHRYVGGKLVKVRVKADDSGCWVASPLDLVQLLTALAGSRGKPLLTQKARAAMVALPPPPYTTRNPERHFGLGWDSIIHENRRVGYSKNGGIPGISAFLCHLPNGVDFAVCFNGSPPAEIKKETQNHLYVSVHQAIQEIRNWPEGDLWEKFAK
jgi:N-acyl-D-amino-acid deacylase